MDADPIPTLDTLLAHREFVRGAARAVLGGDDQVEDVVQETWIRAMRQGPRSPGSLRSWLGRVARNLAIDTRRGAARRKRRETVAAHAESLPSVAEIAEKEEARRRLVAGLLALDEASRSALLLRYYEECPVAEVARRLGVPLETARTRLRRGLARLRESLDRSSGGDRRAWAVALLPWALPRTSLVGLGSAVGGLAVKKLVVWAALVLLALGTGGYLWATRAVGPEGGGSGAPRLVARSEGPAAGDAATDVAAPGLARAPGRAAVPAGTNAGMPYARGVVVDAAGRPLPEVAVLSRGMFEPSPGHKQELDFSFSDVLVSPTTRTDGEGMFRLEKPVPEQVSIVFVKGGFAYGEVRDLSPDPAKNQEIRVTLGKGRRASWTVTDTDGRPIARAQLDLFLAADARGHMLFGNQRTDAQGHCVLDWLPDVATPVQTLFVSSAAYASLLRSGAEIRLEDTLVLRRTTPVVAAVDASSGSPVLAAAGILRRAPDGLLLAALTSNATDRPNFAEAPGVLVPNPWPPTEGGRELATGPFLATVWAPGHATTEAVIEVAIGAEPPRIEIRLPLGEAEPSITGHVEPAGARTLHLCLPPPPGWGEEDVRESRRLADVAVGTDGRFSIRGLPKGRYRLLLAEPGFAPSVTEVEAPALDVSVALQKAARLAVRVSRDDGKPTAGTLVSVGVEGRKLRSTVAAGEDGVARFDGLPEGRAHVALWIDLTNPDWSRLPPHPVVSLVAGASRDTDLRLPSPVPVTIRLRDEGGHGVEGIDLRLGANGGWAGQIAGEIDRLKALELRTDVAGQAAVELYEGSYRATGFVGSLRRTSEIRVAAGRTTIDVPWIASEASLFGRVLAAGTGAPIANRPVLVFSQDRAARDQPWESVTDADGRYEISELPSRPLVVTYRLGYAGADHLRDPASPWPDLSWEFAPASGSRTEHDVSAPRVRGEGAEEAAVPLEARILEAGTRTPLAGATVHVEVGRGDLWIAGGSFRSDERGTASGRVLAGERYRLHVWRAPAGSGETHVMRLLEAKATDGHLDVEVALERKPSDGD